MRIRVLDRIAAGDGNNAADRNYGHLLRPLPILPAPDADKLYSDLMTEFPWMAEVNEEVARAAALSTRHIGKCFTISPMMLNGPSGIGKTRWVRRVAQLSSIPIHFISVAGSDSSKSIMGSERGWSNARPSLPVMALSSTQVVNPIIMVDELDKANASTNGDPFAALLPMLSSETNTTYPDAYLLGSVNLSYSSFIFTANSISKLGTPLLDRIDVFNVSPPSPKDYLAILRGMIAEAAQNTCINESETDDIMERLMGHGMDCLARGDSLRKVERAIKDAVAKYVWKPKSHLTLVK
jgi:ATP-dependent Lon protease